MMYGGTAGQYGEIPYGYKNLWAVTVKAVNPGSRTFLDSDIVSATRNGDAVTSGQIRHMYDWNRDICSVSEVSGSASLVTLTGHSSQGFSYYPLLSQGETFAGVLNVTGSMVDNENPRTPIIGHDDTKEDITNKGVANGYMPLDAGGKAPLEFLPGSIIGGMIHAGDFNAVSGVAILTDSGKKALGTTATSIVLTNDTTPVTGYTSNQGNYYIVTVPGSFAGLSLLSGDWLIANASAWGVITDPNTVTGVKGSKEATYRVGNVTISGKNLAYSNPDMPGVTDVEEAITQAQEEITQAQEEITQAQESIREKLPILGRTALTAALAAADTTISVADISAFPEAPSFANIGTESDAEVVFYTGRDAANKQLTGVTRAQAGTVAKDWPIGADAYHTWSVAVANQVRRDIDGKAFYKEGIWKPVLSSGSVTATFDVPTYIRMGNRVTLTCRGAFTIIDRSSTEAIRFGGLPFTPKRPGNYVPTALARFNGNSSSLGVPVVTVGANGIDFNFSNATGSIAFSGSNYANGNTQAYWFEIDYLTSDPQ